MGIKMVLFDLDGTLLPMNQEEFTNAYFVILVKKLVKHGYEQKQLVKAIWDSVDAMVRNDGSRFNEEAFWIKFKQIYGEESVKDQQLFYDFYKNEFDDSKAYCGYTPQAKEAIETIKDMGCRLVLATNPLFPPIATRKRVEWAGLSLDDFELCTTFDNSRYCKPNIKYYEEILSHVDVKPEECLMIGNDVDEDMIAKELGMNVFLLTDCLLNRKQKDISIYPKGSFDEMLAYVRELV